MAEHALSMGDEDVHPTHCDDTGNSETPMAERVQRAVANLTSDQCMAVLVILEGADGRKTVDDRSPIAYLFDGWLASFQHANGNAGRSLTDEDMTAINRALNAATDALIALPARDAADVQRQVVVALADDDADQGSHAGRLLAAARTALGIAA